MLGRIYDLFITSLIGHFFYIVISISGWLYDGTGSYDMSFILAGVVVALSGVMLFFIPLVKRCMGYGAISEDVDPVEIDVGNI